MRSNTSLGGSIDKLDHFTLLSSLFAKRSIPQQHLLQALQEAVEGWIGAAIVHTHEQHAHVVQDVHYLA